MAEHEPSPHPGWQFLITCIYFYPVFAALFFAASLLESVIGKPQEDTSKISGAALAITLAMSNLCFGFSRAFQGAKDEHRKPRLVLAGSLYISATVFLILMTVERYAIRFHDDRLPLILDDWMVDLLRKTAMLDTGVSSLLAWGLCVAASFHLCAALAAYHWRFRDSPMVAALASYVLRQFADAYRDRNRVDKGPAKQNGDRPSESGEPVDPGGSGGH